MNIGFIGLGHMGNPMVKNLIKHQHNVIVYDVVKAAMKPLIASGAKRAASISDIAEKSDVVITMLQTGQQVSDVCLGEQGLFAKMKQDAMFIDCSSIDIKATRFLHGKAQEKNIAMLDAPVSGGVKGAESATLTFMVGGGEATFQRAFPLLEAMGKKIVHAGGEGTGQAAKICNNMILGITMISVCEAFLLARNLGLSAEKLFEVSANASGKCWSLTNYAPVPGLVAGTPANNDYQPGFSARMMLKDLCLSQTAASASNVATPLGTLATELYTLFVNQGHADLDFSGIIKMLGNENTKDSSSVFRGLRRIFVGKNRKRS